MVVVGLEGSIRPHSQVDPLTSPDAQWCKRIADYPVSGRFGFFVFKLTCDYDFSDYLPNLNWHRVENDYYVAGTVDQWDSVCYALLRSESPEDVCTFYRYIHTKLSDFGYMLRGDKVNQIGGYVLYDRSST